MPQYKTIGFIGLGVMGEPICRNLVKKSGAAVLAFDLAPEPLARLRAEGAGIVIAAGCATAIQLWFRTQAKRSQFRRRQVSSRIATFAEAFSSIGWAATAAIAAVSLPLAIPPGLIALALLIGTRLLAPRQGA